MNRLITFLKPHKKWLLSVVMVLALMSPSRDACATHYAGGDIQYTCIGLRKWKITLTLYRFCDDGAATICGSFACTAPITIQPSPQISAGGLNPNGCSGPPLSLSLSLVKVEDVGKSNVARCGQQSKNSCTNIGQATPGPYRPSIERFIFEGILDMSSPAYANVCPYYDLYYTNCCRNTTTNVNGQPGFVFQATINIHNRSTAACKNNSPLFLNEPVAVFCAGQEYVFNMGATDPDRDSLTYEVMPSLQALNGPVTYVPPYNQYTPFPLNQGLPPHNEYPWAARIVLDTASGDLSMNAKNTGLTPIPGDMSVRIYQWNYIEDANGNRTPIIVGITMRNLQIYSIPCAGNNPPRFETNPSMLNGKPKFNYSVCAGEQICFTVTAKDTDNKPNQTPPRIDTTYLSWNGAIQRPPTVISFKPDYDVNAIPPQRPREDRYKFCWQTDFEDGATLPYYFTIQGEDNFCPNPGRIVRSFSVTVVPYPKADLVKSNLTCGKWAVTMRKTEIRQGLSFAQIEIANSPYDWAFTYGSRVKVAPNFNPGGSGLAPRVLVSDTVQFKLGGKYLVKYTARTPGIEQGQFCERAYYDTILVDTQVQAFTHDTFVCKYESRIIEGSAKWGVAPYTYRWYRTNTTGIPVNGPNFQVNKNYSASDITTTKYILRVQDLTGCISFDSMELEVKNLPVPRYAFDSTRICSYDSFTIDAGNNGGDLDEMRRIKKYTWYKDGAVLGDTTQTITRNDSGQYIQIMTDTFGCRQRDTFNLYVNLPVVANAGSDTSVCPADTVTLKGLGGYKYGWERLVPIPGGGFSRVSVKPKNYIDSVVVSPQVTTDYLLTAYWAYPDSSTAYKECQNTDTVRVNARVRPTLNRPAISHICSSTDSIILPGFFITPASQQNGTGKWSYRSAPGAIIETSQPNYIKIDSLGALPKDTFYLNIENQSQITPNPRSAKDYWVKYSYRGPESEGACLREDSIQIRVYALPKITAGNDVDLCTTNGEYSISSLSGHLYSPKNYQFNPPGVWSVIQGGGLVMKGNPVEYSFNPNPSVAGASIYPAQGVNKLKYLYTLEYSTFGGSKLGCANSDTIVMTVRQPPVLTIGAPNKKITICKNEPEFDIAVKALATNTSTIPNSGKWYQVANPGPGYSPGNISPAIRDSQYFSAANPSVPANGGTWKLYYRDLASGCEAKEELSVEVAPIPVVSVTTSRDSVCKTSAPVLLTSTPAGGTLTGTAVSGTGEFNVSDPSVTGDTRYMFRYEYSNFAGCKNADTTYIYVQQPPVVTTTTVPAKCDYDSLNPFQLSASLTPASPPGRYGLIWTTDDGSGTFSDATSASSTYTFTGADAQLQQITVKVTSTNNGYCAASSATTSLNINPKPDATILSDKLEGCAPFTVSVAAGGAGVGGSTYTWYVSGNQEGTDSTFEKKIDVWGTYPLGLKATTPAGCENSSTKTVYVRAIPVAAFESDPKATTIARPFFNFINKSKVDDGNSLDYIWNFGPSPAGTDPTPRIVTEMNPKNIEFPPVTGKKDVTLIAISKYNGYECADTTEDFVTINPDITVFVPSAFRPVAGGNGVPCADPTLSDCNDVFRVIADGFATIEIFVFNRWGQKVFTTNDAELGWNGKVFNNGEECPQDVYIYQVNATSYNGKKYTYSGSITLLR